MTHNLISFLPVDGSVHCKWQTAINLYCLTISPLNVCFHTLDPLNSSSSDNFGEKTVNNCISNLYIPAKLVTSILQLSQTKFISNLVQENIFGVLTSSKISLRSLGVKWLRHSIKRPISLKRLIVGSIRWKVSKKGSIFYILTSNPAFI